MFLGLEREGAFPYCNWSIKCLGLFGVVIGPAYVNNWQSLGCLSFWAYGKVENSLKQKHIHLLALKKKYLAEIISTKSGASMVCVSIGAKLSSSFLPLA